MVGAAPEKSKANGEVKSHDKARRTLYTSRMRGGWMLPIFFLVTFAGAMVLGPLLYAALLPIWPVPFHRAMDRALIISAVAALWLYRDQMPLRQLWPLDGLAGWQLALGYFIAAVTLQAILGLDFAVGSFASEHLPPGQIAARVLLAAVAALLAPLLEETVFRGFLQRQLIASLGIPAGLILGAAIFALAHFLKIPVELDHRPVHVWSGVTAMGAALSTTVHGAFLNARGANLFLIGLILGGIFLRAGRLWMNAGLHSGWIFGMLIFTGVTRPVAPTFVPWLAGDIVSSLGTTLVLILTGLWIWRFYRHPSDVPANGSNAD